MITSYFAKARRVKLLSLSLSLSLLIMGAAGTAAAQSWPGAAPTARADPQHAYVESSAQGSPAELVPLEQPYQIAPPQACLRPPVLTPPQAAQHKWQASCADIVLAERRSLLKKEAALNALQIITEELKKLENSRKRLTADANDLLTNGNYFSTYLKYLAVEKNSSASDCSSPQVKCVRSPGSRTPTETTSLVALLQPNGLRLESLHSDDTQTLEQQNRLLRESIKFTKSRPNIFQLITHAIKLFNKSDDFLVIYPTSESDLDDQMISFFAQGIAELDCPSNAIGIRLVFASVSSLLQRPLSKDALGEISVCAEKDEILPWVPKYFAKVQRKLEKQREKFQGLLTAQEAELADINRRYLSSRCDGR
jgi:hypothetical protein